MNQSPSISSDKSAWMIYGANGYSGRLIAEEAVSRGHKPVLAGRNSATIQPLAERLGLSWRVFGLDDVSSTVGALQDISLVINCAGPFSATAATMISACLQAKTHYLDITGELAVFEMAKAQGTAAAEAGIVLLPGTGFDVIPTDCLAALLAARMPDAVELNLGFAGGAALSPGTAKTTVEGMKEGVSVRRDGRIETRPNGFQVRQIDFGSGPRQATPIPWGDVSTAFTSTGIANITVYVPASSSTLRTMKLGNRLRPLLRLGPVQRFLKQRIEKSVRGPDEQRRAKMRMKVWGEVRNAKGEVIVGRVETPNGYDMTTWGPVLLAEHILQNPTEAGYTTPSLMMGGDWLESLPGVEPVRYSEA